METGVVSNVTCPECMVNLALPDLPAGQTVQCPRCSHVFEPYRQRAATSIPVPALPPLRVKELDLDEETEPFAERRVGRPPGPLGGERKALVAMIAIAVSSVSFLGMLYMNFEHAQLIALDLNFPVLNAAQQADVDRRINRWEDAIGIVTALHHLVYWPSVVIFLIWLHQASRNLQMLQAEGLSHTPGWAVAAYFVPIANLFRPLMDLQEIWRASDPMALESPRAWKYAPVNMGIRIWWCFFLGAGALSYIGNIFGRDNRDREAEQIAAWIHCISNVGMMVAGGLLIVIILDTSKRQARRYAKLYDEGD